MAAGEMVLCANCGKEHFKRRAKIKRNTTGRFFCCPECKQEYNRKRRKKMHCDYCGAEIEVQPCHQNKKYHFCNQECHNNFERLGSHTTGSFYACEQCGKEVWKTPAEVQRVDHVYCSRECAGKAKQKRIVSVCPECGNEFEHCPSTPRHYCSLECEHAAFKRDAKRGPEHPDYKRVAVQCHWCGKDFEVPPYRLKKRVFCSPECRASWHREVYVKSPEAQKAFREGAAASHRIFQDGKRDTLPQRLMNEMLNDLGIDYKNEHCVSCYAIDNYLSKYDLAIEVCGDYWHANPLVYPQLINKHQLKTIRKDRARNHEIVSEFGIPILYVWESDIIEQPEMVRFLIQEYVDTLGELTEFNSFNYHLDTNGILSRQPEYVRPYIEYLDSEIPLAYASGV